MRSSSAIVAVIAGSMTLDTDGTLDLLHSLALGTYNLSSSGGAVDVAFVLPRNAVSKSVCCRSQALVFIAD